MKFAIEVWSVAEKVWTLREERFNTRAQADRFLHNNPVGGSTRVVSVGKMELAGVSIEANQ